MGERPSVRATRLALDEGGGSHPTLAGPRPRRRHTATRAEGMRLARAIAIGLGRELRNARRRGQLSQRALGARIGAHQTTISRIERGFGSAVPLATWAAIGVALGRPFAAALSKPIDPAAGPRDAGHLAIQEHLLGLARSAARLGTFELPTRPAYPSRSIDVGIRDDINRCLIVVEAWNTFDDLGAAVREMRRKLAEADRLAVVLAGDRGLYRVAGVWVVRASRANRALVGRYPNIIEQAFPGSSASWRRALQSQARPPIESGLVWWDPATRTLAARRRPRDSVP